MKAISGDGEDAIDLASTDLFAVRLSSTSAVERRYAGIGLPLPWEQFSQPTLHVDADPANPEQFAESQALLRNGFIVNGFEAAGCVDDSSVATSEGASEGASANCARRFDL